MKMKKFVAVAVAGCMAASLAACGSTASTSSAAASRALRVLPRKLPPKPPRPVPDSPVQLGPNPETLDPALNSSVDGANTIITIFEPLLLIDEENKVIPGQAESYEKSPDGLTWTFHMRDGLKWSDGSDLTAKDFEYSFKRMADPNTRRSLRRDRCGHDRRLRRGPGQS